MERNLYLDFYVVIHKMYLSLNRVYPPDDSRTVDVKNTTDARSSANTETL